MTRGVVFFLRWPILYLALIVRFCSTMWLITALLLGIGCFMSAFSPLSAKACTWWRYFGTRTSIVSIIPPFEWLYRPCPLFGLWQFIVCVPKASMKIYLSDEQSVRWAFQADRRAEEQHCFTVSLVGLPRSVTRQSSPGVQRSSNPFHWPVIHALISLPPTSHSHQISRSLDQSFPRWLVLPLSNLPLSSHSPIHSSPY